jgi:hypothetical protein
LASTVSDGPTEFAQLLIDATAEALSGSAVATLDRDEQPILNGVPYRVFRQSIALGERRREGMFFSGIELAREVASLLHAKMSVGGLALDPTCGIGDLLLAYAEGLPIEATLDATLDVWGQQLAGIEKRMDLVAMTRARLIALARSRGCFVEPIASVDGCFPQIIVGDMFEERERIAQADGLLFNPPFGQTSDHTVSGWGTGQLSAAALCLDVVVSARAPGTPIAAVLPEVMRCGSRYKQFRARLADAGLGGRFASRGRFDAWTDVDVFTTLLESGASNLWQLPASVSATVGDRFTVGVGAVVPHRHAHRGPWYRFACAKTVPAWSTGFVPKSNRRFQGTTCLPPFVVVRRTSSPSDRKRAVGAIILGDRPVAVENHLIVLTPNDGRLESCVELLAVLACDATSDYLNRAIRCRHLTTGSVKGIPWVTTDE